MRLTRLFVAPALAASLAAACSSDPKSPKPDAFPPTPNPRNATVTLQTTRAVTATVPLAGGTLTATGADGTVYTLTIPGDALLGQATITMTPIASVSDLNVSGGRTIGVHLEPDGLEFFNPVTLRMQPPEGPNVSAVGFSYHGMGTEIHRAPLTADPSRLEMKLMHFSGEGAMVREGYMPVVTPLDAAVPTDPADQLDYVLERLARIERDRQRLEGSSGTSPFIDDVAVTLDQFWTKVLEPKLNRMQTDCAFYEQNKRAAVGFVRKVGLFDFDHRFTAEAARTTASVIAAIKNCWGETIEPCLDEANQEHVSKAIEYSRSLELLGVSEPRYDVTNRSIYCVDWLGDFTSSGPTIHGPPETVTGVKVSFELDLERSSPEHGFYSYRVSQGTIDWSVASGMSVNSCPLAAGHATFTIQPTDGFLELDQSTATPTYRGSGAVAGAYGTAIESCPGKQPRTLVFPVGAWFWTGPVPVAAGTEPLTGSTTFDGRTYQWTLSRGSSGGAR